MKKIVMVVLLSFLFLEAFTQNQKIFTKKIPGHVEVARQGEYLYFFEPIQIDTVDCDPSNASAGLLVCDGRSVTKKEVTIIKVSDSKISTSLYKQAFENKGRLVDISVQKHAYRGKKSLGMMTGIDYEYKELIFNGNKMIVSYRGIEESSLSFSVFFTLLFLCIYSCRLVFKETSDFYRTGLKEMTGSEFLHPLLITIFLMAVMVFCWIVNLLIKNPIPERNQWIIFGGCLINCLLHYIYYKKYQRGVVVLWWGSVLMIYYGFTLDLKMTYSAALLSVAVMLINGFFVYKNDIKEFIDKTYKNIRKLRLKT